MHEYPMKKIIFFLSVFLFSLSLYGQPWLRYLPATKSQDALTEYQSLKKAFYKYLKEYGPAGEVEGAEEEEEGYLPFVRWMWLVDQRITEDSYIQSSVYWDEILHKEEARKKGELLGSWSFLGPEDPPTDINTGQVIGAGRVDCIAFHPTDSNTFWVGAPTGGLWKTTDGGKSWEPLTDFAAGIGISDIAVHPERPETLFIATGDRDAHDLYSVGVLKTYDGGKTWTQTAMAFDQSRKRNVNRLLMRPDRPNTMIAATDEGIYYITRYGDSYRKVQDGNFKDLEFMPGQSDTVYAATYSYGNATVYRSDDGGQTFKEISTGIKKSEILRIDLAVTPDRPDMVVALCVEKTKNKLYGIYRSLNKGESWTKIFSGSTKNLLGNSPTGDSDDGQGWYDLTLSIAPDNYREMYVGGINMWRSTNGGTTWNLVSWGYPESSNVDAFYIHVDQHISAFHPLTGALYAGNDGGLFRTYDKGESWTDLSDGLEILQIYRIGLSPTKRKMSLMGSQDNSSILWKDTAWNVVIGGDGMECIIDYTDTNTLYASAQYGNIRRSVNGGYSFRGIKPADAGQGAWVTPYVMFPDDHLSLLAGYSEIYRTNNQGNSWEKLTDSLSGGEKYKTLAVSSYDPQFIYAATSSNIWRSEDRGASWVNIKTGLPSSTITGIAISQYDPKKIWVSLSNYNEGVKVYASVNGGASWSNYSEGLPNVPVNCILYQNNSNSALYVGTDLGVYVRDRSMDRWKDFSGFLPNVIVNELEIYYPDSLLRAGTYGRGLWESKLYFPDSLSLYAEFSGDRLQSCLQSNFTFYNRYPGPLDSLIWIFDGRGTPQTIRNRDTVQVSFDTPGKKDVWLAVYYNGAGDTLYRQAYVAAVTYLDVTLTANFKEYYWKGNPAVLRGSGADDYMWIALPGQDTLYGSEITVYPDTTVTYTLYSRQGYCSDTDTIVINVWPNDNIRYALPLQYGENGSFVNFEATVEKNEPAPPAGDCNTDSTWCDEFYTGKDYLAHSVWFYFLAPPGGTVSIDSRGFDNQIAVYDAASPDSLLAGNYTLLAANDDYHGAGENYAAAIVEINGLEEGKKYWVQVDGSGGNKTGTFYLYLYDSPLGIRDIADHPGHRNFVIFPNPNNGTFSLLFDRKLPPGSMMEIFTSDGKMILQKKLPGISEGESFPIPVKLHEKGIYLIRIITHDAVLSEKMIVR